MKHLLGILVGLILSTAVFGQAYTISTLAGGVEGFSGDGGPARNATLASPRGLALDGSGNLFIADTGNSRIRRIDAKTGIITTVAGNRIDGEGGDGTLATSARLYLPGHVAVDTSGNLFISGYSDVRRVDARTGIITTIAGGSTDLGDGGPATKARLDAAAGLALDGLGHLFIADEGKQRVRRIDLQTGMISTFAGNGSQGFSGDGGPAANATLFGPSRLAVDSSGNVFIADKANYSVRRVDAKTGIITTVAGTGSRGFNAGPGAATKMGFADVLEGLALDEFGNLFIGAGYDVWQVNSRTGIIAKVAGNGSRGFGEDGGPATRANLDEVHGLIVDGSGGVFISDGNRVRKLTPRP
jgi:sugar lactone lactonase YvrE